MRRGKGKRAVKSRVKNWIFLALGTNGKIDGRERCFIGGDHLIVGPLISFAFY